MKRAMFTDLLGVNYEGKDMSSAFEVSIPEIHWHHISNAPKTGRVIIIRDGFGHVDLAKWSNEEWTAEFGVCDEPTHFSYVSIVDA